jgi:hypothetical protein
MTVNQAVNHRWDTPSARPRVNSIAWPVKNCSYEIRQILRYRLMRLSRVIEILRALVPG